MNILSQIKLNGKVAIVTGGYGHLGKSLCLGLAEAGAKVVCCGRDAKKFKTAFGKNPKIVFQQTDVSSTVSIRQSFKEIKKKHKKIDILVNNAVFLKMNSPEKVSDEDWEYSIGGSLESVFCCIKEVIPYMKANKKGSIVNVSSMYGVVSPDFKVYQSAPKLVSPPHYGAGKAGVIQLTKYYAIYLAKNNVRVNSIAPGAFPSSMVQKNKKFVKALSQKIPLGRVGKPEELKGLVVFLSSDASSYITGQNIMVDGGWTAW